MELEENGYTFIEAEYDSIFGMGFNDFSEIKTTTPFSNMFTGNLNYNNVSTIDSKYKYWILDVNNNSINGKKLNFKNKKAIFDTGSNIIYMPYEDAATYYKFINRSSNNYGHFTVPCNTTDHVAYIIGSINYNIDQSDLITGQIGIDGMWIIGDTFLKNDYSV
ncbi:aspartic peptidase domain-containing protein [Gigaspora rosea]|uniref:Aspartic peptidase domain-containing protein n=1 Tax=Gigaspora rosea TaxID=44941 RepID=A0A397VKQ3_9GLOM|nr:aspartic peptidase domain-containing protein [Gigaspora rosea]